MKNELIGDSSIFAIEYLVTKKSSHVWGKIRIWLNNIYIGYFDEENLLGVPALVLRDLKARLNASIISRVETSDMFLFNDQIIDINKHILSLGEGFDDFSMRVAIVKNNFLFVWQLLEDSFFNYPNYPKSLNYATVEISYFEKVVNQFNEAIFK